MYYFIITADGNRYGPADIDTLVAWVGEGRIVASTMLIERGTEREVLADSITAISAALRRRSGQGPAVAVERDEPGSAEIPTASLPPQARVAGQGPPPVPQATPPVLAYARRGAVGPKSKVVAGLLGIFLGGLGVHRFYLGHVWIGIAQIVVTVATCGYGSLWGFVEGIVCLCGGIRDSDGLELHD